jgi:hypothetical protein
MFCLNIQRSLVIREIIQYITIDQNKRIDPDEHVKEMRGLRGINHLVYFPLFSVLSLYPDFYRSTIIVQKPICIYNNIFKSRIICTKLLGVFISFLFNRSIMSSLR